MICHLMPFLPMYSSCNVYSMAIPFLDASVPVFNSFTNPFSHTPQCYHSFHQSLSVSYPSSFADSPTLLSWDRDPDVEATSSPAITILASHDAQELESGEGTVTSLEGSFPAVSYQSFISPCLPLPLSFLSHERQRRRGGSFQSCFCCRCFHTC